ncbi:unnamed protein product, partial [Polarella glacialis]
MLNQEFWLQQKRREAEKAKAAALGQPPGLAAAAQGPWNQMGSMPGAGMVRPPMMMMRPPGPGILGSNMIAGMPWVAPRRLGSEMIVDRLHKDWNSDDEDIDEYGRKKRRKTEKGSAASSKGKANDKAEEKGDGEEPAKDSKEKEPVPSKKTSKLSEKQQAALDRLRARAVKPPPPKEPEPAAADHQLLSMLSEAAASQGEMTPQLPPPHFLQLPTPHLPQMQLSHLPPPPPAPPASFDGGLNQGLNQAFAPSADADDLGVEDLLRQAESAAAAAAGGEAGEEATFAGGPWQSHSQHGMMFPAGSSESAAADTEHLAPPFSLPSSTMGGYILVVIFVDVSVVVVVVVFVVVAVVVGVVVVVV